MSESKRIAKLRRELEQAQRKSDAACARRAALPIGTSRARITTANAKWMIAAEARDRADAALRAALADGGVR